MIPRLVNTYPFTGTGITLTDTISCKVTEERNGAFELEMVVATTTPYFEEIKEGRYILAKPNHTQGAQAFEIYEISRPINQRVTIRAHHISYRLSFIPVEPFSCTGITDTLNGLISHSIETNPFTFTTTITNEQSTYNQTAPASIRSRLGGTEGSVLDVFGGEYVWDNLTVSLLLHRGQDNGVQLRVAKNISALEQTTNLENVVTGALPYWSNEDGTVNLYGDIQYNSHVNDYDYKRTVLLDLSEQFETAPSSTQLNTAAQQYVNQANLGIVNTNIKLSFVDLADTNEYEGSPLERVNLCDTVTVIYNPLSITYQAKAIRLTYDVLAERTLEVEVGDAKSTIAKTISDLVGDISSVVTVGKKLVSVTQKIDREVGEISQTVAEVQENTSTITNMLYDTNAPSLAKVYGDYDRYFSSGNNSSYIQCTYISLSDAPRPTINYGVNINVIQTIPSGRVRAIAWPNLTLTAGTTYTLSCYARLSTTNTGGNIGVYLCYGANPYADAGYGETYYVTSTEWTRFSWTFTADSTYFNASGKTLIYVGMFALSGTTAGGIDLCNYFLQPSDYTIENLQNDLSGVNSQITTINTNVSNITQTTQSIQTQVTQTQTTLENDYATKDQLSSSVSSLSTTIEQTAQDLTIDINKVKTTTTEQGEEISQINSYFEFASDGLTIGKSDSEVRLKLENDELSFNNNSTKLAWLDSDDGLGANALSIGDATTASNRWRVFTRENGSHLTFTRHS